MKSQSRLIQEASSPPQTGEAAEPVYSRDPLALALVRAGRLGISEAERAVRLKESQQG
ncbi:MAG: hypothetical protein ABW068_11635 [Candidatus Thiodiazotropha sp.]